MIQEADSGWVINGNVDDIKEHLISLSNTKKEIIAQKGKNGLEYSSRKLLWKEIGRKSYRI